jgi:uncharacterized membrane protein YciS (DUF1049 family)
MKRLLQFIILLPVAIVGVAFAVANRHEIGVSFDPFSKVTELQVKAPLFIVLILALMVGVVLGGSFTWFAQGRHRRALRDARGEAARWRGHAERLQVTPASSSPAYSGAQKEPSATAPRKLLAHT